MSFKRYMLVHEGDGSFLVSDPNGDLMDAKQVTSAIAQRDAEIARLRAELAKAKEQVDELEWRQSMIDQTGQRIRDHAERAGFDFPDMDDEVGAMADSLIAMRAELDAAKAVIEKVAKTRDGAIIYPDTTLYPLVPHYVVDKNNRMTHTDYRVGRPMIAKVMSLTGCMSSFADEEAARRHVAAKENPNAKA